MKTLVFLIFSWALVSCSNGGSGNPATSPVVTQEPVGEFTSLKTLDAWEIPGCTTESTGFDQRLKVGSKISYSSQEKIPSGEIFGFDEIHTETIEAISHAAETKTYRIDIDLGASKFWVRLACFPEGGEIGPSYRCESTEASPNINSFGEIKSGQFEKQMDYFGCTVRVTGNYDPENYKTTHEEGTFVTKSGRSYKAYRTVTETKGRIFCWQRNGDESGIELKDMELNGTMRDVRIATSEISSMGNFSCGGTERVYDYTGINKEDGSPYIIRKYEVYDFSF